MKPSFARFPLVIAALLTPGAALAITLDAFTDAFPPIPCLPVSAQPIIFQGTVCDGTSCPPDPWSNCWENLAQQTGLAGVLGGRREARVLAGSDVASRVRPELGVLEVTSAGPTNHLVHLTYGTRSGDPAQSLNLDLSAAIAVRIPLHGNVAAAEPMDLFIGLWGNGSQAGPPNADVTVNVTESGDLVVPLSAFTQRFGFSFAEVWGVEVAVDDCNAESCPDEPYPARSYTLGPITIDGGVVPTAASSWGSVKIRYR
jgi:hypothetical protein